MRGAASGTKGLSLMNILFFNNDDMMSHSATVCDKRWVASVAHHGSANGWGRCGRASL